MLNATVLRDSFELVIDRRPDLTVRFYEILFERAPHLAPMFRNDRGVQAKMLAGAITAVLDHLEDSQWLGDTLGALGAKHVGYGVTPEMYDIVGGALLATFAEIAGEQWNPYIATQWVLAYTTIVSLMRAGEMRAAA